MTSIPVRGRKESTDRRGEGHVKTRRRGRRDADTKHADSHQKLDEARKDPPLEPPEGAQLC